jgi:hypothetical protein
MGPGFLFIFVILPTFWPPGDHLENPNFAILLTVAAW